MGARRHCRAGSHDETAGASVERIEMNWRERVLTVITNPNIAYILMSIGWLGSCSNFTIRQHLSRCRGGHQPHPRFLFAADAADHYAGLALIGLALILFLMEIKIVSHGLLTIGGCLDAHRLSHAHRFCRSGGPNFIRRHTRGGRDDRGVFIFAISMAIKIRRTPPRRALRADRADCHRQGRIRKTGMVYVSGEYWKAETTRRCKRERKSK